MRRSVLDLWTTWLLPMSFLVTFGGLGLYFWTEGRSPLNLAVAGGVFTAGAIVAHHRWLRMAVKVWRYRTRPGNRVRVHYPGQLEAWLRDTRFLEAAEREYEALAERFGFRLWPAVRVYIVPTPTDVRRLFGDDPSARALLQVHGIIMTPETSWEYTLRHELVHLFQHKLNPQAPALFDEGSAVWLASDQPPGRPSPESLRLLRDRLRLRTLFDWYYFITWEHRRSSYELAGHFVRYLIGRFGWKRYRKLYRRLHRYGINRNCRRVLGESFDELEAQWREQLDRGDPFVNNLLDSVFGEPPC